MIENQEKVSIPYGKGKVEDTTFIQKVVAEYQFPMGKVKY